MNKEKLIELINEVLEEQALDEEGKKDACYHKVKARYDVWPSAYASGALVKCRKVGAKNWGNKSKKDEALSEAEVTDDEEEELKDVSKQLKGAVKAHGKQAKLIDKALKKENKKKSIELEERCQKGYKTHDTQKTKKMFGNTYRNCVKAEEGQLDEEGLRDWFDDKDGDGQKGWEQIGGKYDGKPCAKQPGQKTKPKCASPEKAASMSKKERDSAAKRKRKKDPNPNRKGKAKNVNTDPKKGRKKKNEVLDMRKGLLYEGDESILEMFKGATLEDGTLVCEACLFETLQEASCGCPDLVMEAEYQGRKVTLNKPTRGDVKKFKVYVKDPKTGNIKKVNFGHGGSSAKSKGEKTMKIRKNNPKARKSFRARHNCDNPGPKTKARYWSCKKW